MNLRYCLLTLLTATVVTSGAYAYARMVPSLVLDGSARSYHECIALASEEPATALKISQQSLDKDYSTIAHHCRAVSLFTMGNYPEATIALESLAKQISANSPKLRAGIIEQAAISRQKSGDHKGAVLRLTEALTELVRLPQAERTSQMLSILQRRSALYSELNQPFRALQDIEHALTLVPNDPSLEQQHLAIMQKLGYAPVVQASAQ